MPPKRKKKKLGGPGRKKANPVPVGVDTPATQPSDVTMTDTPIETPSQQAAPEAKIGDTQNEEGEGSGSDSEAEGSEEGEIEEDVKSQSQPQTELVPGSQEAAPEALLSKHEGELETTVDTAMIGVTPEPKANDVPVSDVLPELIQDMGAGVPLPKDTEMQDVIATEATPDQSGILQTTISSLAPETAGVNVPDPDTLQTSTSISADVQFEHVSTSQAPASAEEKTEYTDVRPVPAQITPEPVSVSAEAETIAPPAPLDTEIPTQDAQSQSQPEAQPPQLVSTSPTGPAEGTDPPTIPTPDLASDKNTPPPNPAQPPLQGDDPATQSSPPLPDPEPVVLPSEPTPPTNVEPTTSDDKEPASAPALAADQTEPEPAAPPPAPAADSALDLLGGLEAAVDKEATANSSEDVDPDPANPTSLE